VGLGGHVFHLARDGIADVQSAVWPGWSFVRMSCGRPDLPLLVRAPWLRLAAAQRVRRPRPFLQKGRRLDDQPV
jgi:hypothetical protein